MYESQPARTLTDSIAEDLDVVFVGINPTLYSVERGHDFARRANKFWPCLSRSARSRRAREALRVAVLGPEHDRAILEFGIGFTDVLIGHMMSSLDDGFIAFYGSGPIGDR